MEGNIRGIELEQFKPITRQEFEVSLLPINTPLI